MKCPRCLSVCLESDPICFSCRRPLVGPALYMPTPAYGLRMAIVFMVVGTCLGPVVCRAFFPAMSRELFDFNSLLFAGTGAVLGALIGYPLGRFLGER